LVGEAAVEALQTEAARVERIVEAIEQLGE
jgi:hypothetical protein